MKQSKTAEDGRSDILPLFSDTLVLQTKHKQGEKERYKYEYKIIWWFFLIKKKMMFNEACPGIVYGIS